MSVTIRLARTGRKNLPSFKIVVANTRSKRNGEILDTIGSYNPSEKPEFFKYDKEKVAMWQQRGALMTESVKKLIEGTYKFVAYPSARKVKLQAEAEKRKSAKA